MRRNQLGWGVVLLVIGGLLLLESMDITLPNGISPMELLWPILLIFLGAWILLGVFMRGNVEAENAFILLEGAQDAVLKINHGAGELKVHSGAGPTELVSGYFSGGMDKRVNRSGSVLDVRIRPAVDAFVFPFFGSITQLDWDVALNSEIPTALTLSTGANKAVIDLRDMRLTDLRLESGASETRLMLPSRGRFRADLDLGAASLEVIVPEGLAARIHTSVGAVDLKIDESRFPRAGDFYQSPDFAASPNSVDMTIDAGAASIRIR